MKVAMLAPLEESIPPKEYGGTELIVFNLVSELVKMGHDVTLFATGDADVPCEVEAIFPQAIRKTAPYDTDQKARESIKWVGIGKVIEKLHDKKFDIVHNHIGWRFLTQANVIKQPLVTTLHGSLHLTYQHAGFTASPDYQFVSISDNQRRALPHLHYIRTVYNGITVEKFPFSEKQGDYLCFLGRFSPEKGIKEAIEIAQRTGMTLKIMAKVDLTDQAYYESMKSAIDGTTIQFLGEVEFEKKTEVLKNAYALLAPIQWEEPFGLNVIESMACGTPVIGTKRGSFPELITPGKDGFLGSSINDCIRLVGDVVKIDRKNCRQTVTDRFTSTMMAEGYVDAYTRIIDMYSSVGRKEQIYVSS